MTDADALSWHHRLTTEWLLTSGLGGFAMGTTLGANTRRYHGLLTVAARPPVCRVLVLHSTFDEVVFAGRPFSLTTQQFGETFLLHPGGWKHLCAFRVEPPHAASWTYLVGGLRIERRLELSPSRHGARLQYAWDHPPERLRIRPLTPMRDFHSLSVEDDEPPTIEAVEGRVMRIRRGELELQLTASAGCWRESPDWWRNFAYREDRDRGQRWQEAVWSPGDLELTADAFEQCDLPLTIEVALLKPRIDGLPVQKHHRSVSDDPQSRLRVAADQFVVKRQTANGWTTSIIAGYPWFADWGRDTMICLPGLLLGQGRIGETAQTLMTFARHIRRGLVPNRFDDYGGEPHYNTVDASLWFIHAAGLLLELDPACEVRPKLVDACCNIVEAYRAGTDFNIHMDEDALIAAGDPSTQLTWMDAQRDGISFTPRFGKAIEINALWHHALHVAATLVDGALARDLRMLAERAATSIREQFWWPERGCCHDLLLPVSGTWRGDRTLRPNQVFAVSLDPSPLAQEQRKAVLLAIRERLVTPFGLRTLDPDHPAYRSRYEGSMAHRDAAYHQGTAWPWLLGPYAEAVLRVGSFSAEAREEARACLEPLLAELDRGCLGQLAEVYDGDPPHRPSGCPAQAWSVAELLRILRLLDTGPGVGPESAAEPAASRRFT